MYRKTLVYLLFVFLALGSLSCRTSQISAEKQDQWLAKGYRSDKNGWIFLHIEGKPFERGFQRGYLTANEIEEFLRTLAITEEFETAQELVFFIKAASRLFKNKVPKEYVEEIRGMVAGMDRAGKRISYDEVLFMNGFIDILWYWWPQEKKVMAEERPGCSAFIATGQATTDGRIVMGHNSWISYAIGRFCNIIVDILPEEGHRILMQSWGPCLYSGTDFFITGTGLIGTETTIGGFEGFDSKGIPVFVRARKAMQYANSIDEWARIMIENNNGAYANAWLLGDIKTGQIARLELGLKHHRLEKKNDGYFTGSNVAEDTKILRIETKATWDDIRDRHVARRVRWGQLMKEHYGEIDIEAAKRMLADHYDVYLQKEQPTLRTICGHGELDDGSVPGSRRAYWPGGAVDGKVVDSDMARDWQLWAKWGSSCDIVFDANEFLEKHPQYGWLKDCLGDLSAKPWMVFPSKKAGRAFYNSTP